MKVIIINIRSRNYEILLQLQNLLPIIVGYLYWQCVGQTWHSCRSPDCRSTGQASDLHLGHDPNQNSCHQPRLSRAQYSLTEQNCDLKTPFILIHSFTHWAISVVTKGLASDRSSFDLLDELLKIQQLHVHRHLHGCCSTQGKMNAGYISV